MLILPPPNRITPKAPHRRISATAGSRPPPETRARSHVTDAPRQRRRAPGPRSTRAIRSRCPAAMSASPSIARATPRSQAGAASRRPAHAAIDVVAAVHVPAALRERGARTCRAAPARTLDAGRLGRPVPRRAAPSIRRRAHPCRTPSHASRRIGPARTGRPPRATGPRATRCAARARRAIARALRRASAWSSSRRST